MTPINQDLSPAVVEEPAALSPDLLNEAVLFLVRQAVQTPLDEQTDISLFEFRLSQKQEDKLNELAQVLNLSLATTINSALCYSLEYVKRRGILSLSAARGYPNRLGRKSLYCALTPKTANRLRLEGITEVEQLQFAAVLGVSLLHRRTMKMT